MRFGHIKFMIVANFIIKASVHEHTSPKNQPHTRMILPIGAHHHDNSVEEKIIQCNLDNQKYVLVKLISIGCLVIIDNH